MLEIEAKMRVPDFAAVRARLVDRGARFVGRYAETNYILDRVDGSLRASGCGLRVRSMDTVEGRDVAATMTFKGPVLKSSVKTREEIEIDISDTDTSLSLLTAIGFQTVMSYRKRRERWDLGDCHIELDEVPLLGTFVEVEGPDEAAVRKARRRIGLGDEPHIRTGYVRMLSDRCRETGRPVIGIGFEST